MIRIRIVEGASERSVDLVARSIVRIGRDPSNDIVVRDRFVSSRHGELRLDSDHAVYEDFVTTNGSCIRRGEAVTRVDGACSHRVAFREGDELLLGDSKNPVVLTMCVVPDPVRPRPGEPEETSELDATHADVVGRLTAAFDRDVLLALHRIATRLSVVRDAREILVTFSESLLQAFRKANHVSIHLLQDGSREFAPAVARSRDGDTGPHPVSRTVRDRVLRQGKAVAFDETEADFNLADSLHESAIRSGLCAPLWDGSRVMGLVQVDCRGGLSRTVFGREDLAALAVFAHQAALALANAKLHEDLCSSVEHSIQGLVNALEAKDPYTAGHSEAVAELCARACEALALEPDAARAVYRAALLHDIGKIGIPYHVLNKREALTPDEFRVLKSHPEVGARILQPYDFLADLVPIVLHHHERWDGRGYPAKLAGEKIPLGARILAVVDTWHTLVSSRPYRLGMDPELAIEELRRCAGTQFDPRIVEVVASLVATPHADEERPVLV